MTVCALCVVKEQASSIPRAQSHLPQQEHLNHRSHITFVVVTAIGVCVCVLPVPEEAYAVSVPKFSERLFPFNE